MSTKIINITLYEVGNTNLYEIPTQSSYPLLFLLAKQVCLKSKVYVWPLASNVGLWFLEQIKNGKTMKYYSSFQYKSKIYRLGKDLYQIRLNIAHLIYCKTESPQI